MTSLDWNTVSPSLIITSSIDTTCTIWDIPTLTAKTQLIAHDKEVFDVRFCANSVDVFVSCGADGSVRMFDLRSLEHSTIIYEPSAKDDKGISPSNVLPLLMLTIIQTRAQAEGSAQPSPSRPCLMPLHFFDLPPHHMIPISSPHSPKIRILLGYWMYDSLGRLFWSSEAILLP